MEPQLKRECSRQSQNRSLELRRGLCHATWSVAFLRGSNKDWCGLENTERSASCYSTFLLNVPDCLRHQQTSKISKILVSHIRIASQLFLRQNQHSQKSTSKEPWVDLRLLGCPGVWRANCQWSLHMNMVKLLKVLVAECKITLLFLTTCLQKRKCLAQIFVDEYNYGTNASLTISFCSLRLVENVCAKEYGTLGIGLSYNRSYSKQVSMHVEVICKWSGEESYCSFKKDEWIWFWNFRKHFVWQVW